jgi:hypothetical protein
MTALAEIEKRELNQLIEAEAPLSEKWTKALSSRITSTGISLR